MLIKAKWVESTEQNPWGIRKAKLMLGRVTLAKLVWRPSSYHTVSVYSPVINSESFVSLKLALRHIRRELGVTARKKR